MFWNSVVVASITTLSFTKIELTIIVLGLIPIVITLSLVLFLEIVVKFLLLREINLFSPSETTLEDHEHLDLDLEKFHFYCNDLEAMGFKELIDYTCPPMKGMARLFCYPMHNCYAEVGALDGFSASCSIVGRFERNWFFTATNYNGDVNLRAISYAFLCLPQNISKFFDEEPKALFESFLVWKSEIKDKLAIEENKITDAEMYFSWIRYTREMQRQRLLRKSIIISLREMHLFTLNPKSEWLGDYPKSSN